MVCLGIARFIDHMRNKLIDENPILNCDRPPAGNIALFLSLRFQS